MVLALVVLGAGAAVGWAVWPEGEDDYTHRLQRYGNEKGEPNVYVNLPDGEAQVALGSPDQHRLVVQWRDPDGHGWTEPETVYTDQKMLALESTVRYGGGTAAIVMTYVLDFSSDSDIGNEYVAVVCRDRTCEARRGSATEAQVTPDGSTVYLGGSEKGPLFWEAGQGFHRERWSGHPGYGPRSVTGTAELTPDGSLRLVGTHPGRRACTFTLYTSPPRSADLTAAATRTERLRRPRLGGSDCGSYIATWSDDWLQVNSDDHRAATFWFVRDGETWTATRKDASGLDLIDVRRGCCDTYEAGFIHWNSVAFGSPDGRRIQVQSHLLGEEQWSEPVLLDGAPPRSRCGEYMDLQESGPTGVVVVMRCRDGYALAASTDLKTWTSTYYRGPEGEPIGSDEGLRIADRLVWTPEDGFVA